MRGESSRTLKSSTGSVLSLLAAPASRQPEIGKQNGLLPDFVHARQPSNYGGRESYFFFRMVFSIPILVMTLSTMVMTTVGTNTVQKE